MKKQNMLVITLLALFVSACTHDPAETASSQEGHPTAVTLPGETKSNDPTARLGVGRYFNVSGQWARPEWTRKGDFNGDGKWDIVSLNGSAGQAYVKFSQGEEGITYIHDPWTLTNLFSSVAGYTFTGDFNGDGYSDIASASGNQVYMHINNHVNAFNATQWPVSAEWGQPYNTVVGDFNGDGKDDIASLSGSYAYMKISTGSAFSSVPWQIDPTYGATGWTFATDFNGDGYDDILSVTGGTIYIKQSTGSSFISYTHNTSSTWGSLSYTWTGDTNNNGKGELITAIGNQIYIKEYNGSTLWSTPAPTIVTNVWGSDGYNWVENFNGVDGDEIVSAIGSQIFVH